MKTKLFTGHYTGSGSDRRFVEVDTEINEFLEINEVNVIDIKFTTAVDLEGCSWNSALLMYK